MASRVGPWARFGALVIVTAVVLLPIAGLLGAAFRPGRGSPLQAFGAVISGPGLAWFGNSLAVSLATVLVSICVAAPAGYVLARGRSRAISGYSLVIFATQSFPLVLAIVPLFIIFAKVGLVDSLPGITLIYLTTSVPAAVWMMASYMGSIPVALEEAAWLDGCSLLSGFVRVILRNSLPAVLSTALFTFLLAWNEYLVALVFLRSQGNYTLGIGVAATGGQPALTILMILPPVALFLVFNRFFSVGGIAGSLAGS